MKTVTKALPTGNISTVFDHPTEDELNIINTRTQREFKADELYVITVHLANNDKDKSKQFLNFFERNEQQRNGEALRHGGMGTAND